MPESKQSEPSLDPNDPLSDDPLSDDPLSDSARLAASYRDGLLQDVLPFWLEHGLDWEFGGYTTCLAADGSLVDTDKSVWHQGRFAWLLSKLFNTVERNRHWLEAAKLGIDFLDRHCFDPADGRMWFQVARDGTPIRKRRYAYSESFAAIAYAQFAKASGDEQYRRKAVAAFERFVDHNLNPPANCRKLEPGRTLHGLGFPMIALATAQELREAIAYEQADDWIDRSLGIIRDKHIHEELQVVLESVGPDGVLVDHFDGRTLNPGHAIEAAWFIMWEGQHRADRELIQLGANMLRWMWKRGWDSEYGGLNYFVDLHGGAVQEYWHDMKFWWPHNEAIIATLLAYLLTGEQEFRRWHGQVHRWSYDHFPDPEHGEWFGYLHRDGTLSSNLKGNLWKGPFHLPRMQLVCWQLLEQDFSRSEN